MKKHRFRRALLATMIFITILGGIIQNNLVYAKQIVSTEVDTITIYAPLPATEEACERVSEAISEITLSLLQCKVKLIRNVSTVQMNMLLSSKEAVDLFTCFPWESSLVDMAETNQILGMNQLLEQYGQETFESISAEDWNCVTVDGQIYGVPLNKDKAQGRGFLMVKSIADELGIDYSKPMNYSELERALRKVKEAYPQMYPVVPSDGSMINPAWAADTLGDSLGVLENCLENDTTVVNLYDCDAFKEYCSYIYRWVQQGLMLPDAVNTMESSNDLIGSGIGWGTFSPYKAGIEVEESRNKGKEMAIIQLDEPYSTTTMVNSCWVIAAKSTNPQKAMQVLNLMYTNPEVSNLLVNGMQGENWVFDDEDNEVICFPEGVNQFNTDYSVYGWIWPNEQITYIWQGEKHDVWKELDEFNKKAKASPAKGFIWRSESVRNEVAACTKIVNKYFNGLITGCLDPDKAIPRLNAELKAAGIDKVIKEKQAQLDFWLDQQN